MNVCELKKMDLNPLPKLVDESKNNFRNLRLLKFYENNQYTDCTFIVEEKSYEVHKIVFAASSPVFEKMLYGKLSSNTNKLTDMSTSVFESILRFIYTDEVQFTSVENAWLVFCAANKYLMSDLCERSIIFIQDNLSISTLLLSYEYADMFQLNIIKHHCLFNISSYIKGIFAKDYDYHMKLSTLLKILAHYEYLNINLEELFINILEWVREECKCCDLNENAANMMAVIEKSELKYFFQTHSDDINIEYMDKLFDDSEMQKCFLLLKSLPVIRKDVPTKKKVISWLLHSVKRQVFKICERIAISTDTEIVTGFVTTKKMMLFAVIANSESSNPSSPNEYTGKISLRIHKNSSDSEDAINVTNITKKFSYNCTLYLPLSKPMVLLPNTEYICRISYSNLDYDDVSVRSVLLHYMAKKASYGKENCIFQFFETYGSVLRGLSVYPA